MKQIRSLLNRSNSETRGQQSGASSSTAGPSAEGADVPSIAPPEQPAEPERADGLPAPG